MEFQIEIVYKFKFRIFKVIWMRGIGMETFYVKARNGEMVIENNRPLAERQGRSEDEVEWKVIKGALRDQEVQNKILSEIKKYISKHEFAKPIKGRKR